jgi:hypothetical protein
VVVEVGQTSVRKRKKRNG